MTLEKKETNLPTSERIEKLEKEFLKQPQVHCPVIHRFGPGSYIREVKIPAGSFAIGHHQNFEHMNILIQGRVTVRNEDGTFTELKAPMVFVGKPGRKVGYIHEDMIWLNVYATDETDIEKLEAHFLTKSVTFLDSILHSKGLIELESNIDQNDFKAAIKELGLTEEKVRAQSENMDDVCGLPHGSYKFKIGKSKIEGQGIFATGEIESGEIIAPARIAGKRTVIGRLTNHSRNPNARMVRGSGSDIDLVAIKKLKGCHGGIDGEEITINYREAYALTLEIGKVE